VAIKKHEMLGQLLVILFMIASAPIAFYDVLKEWWILRNR